MQAMIDELAKQAAESLGQVSSKETLSRRSRKLDLKMSEKVIMASPFFIFWGDGVRGKNPPVTALP